MHARRRIQRNCIIFGGCPLRTSDSNSRRTSHLRHGRTFAIASVAVYPSLCQKNRRSATGILHTRDDKL